MNYKTAILIFANSAEKEQKQKSFQNAGILFETLNQQVIKKVEKTGIPYFLISEEKQKGNNFGERYTNTIEWAYSKGFDNIITIGNDTPNLSSKQLITALEMLEQNKTVLGPSKDGGYYLLGLHKSQFNKEAFLKLPWQTSALKASISQLLLAQKNNLFFLKILQDIDNIDDVKKLVDNFKKLSATLFKIVIALFYTNIVSSSITVFFISSFLNEKPFNKGSPSPAYTLL